MSKKKQQKLKAEQRSNVAIIFAFNGRKNMFFQYWEQNKPGKYSKPFKTEDACILAAFKDGFKIVIDSNGGKFEREDFIS